MAASFTKKDIEKVIEPFLKTSNGYSYLPEANTEPAIEALYSKYINVYTNVNESKEGIKKLEVGRFAKTRMSIVYEVYIR